ADIYSERLWLALQQTLRREHVPDLGRADAERECSECTVGAGMAVAANDSFSRLCGPQFRADDMDDAAVGAVHREHLEAELAAVVLHRDYLLCSARAGRLQVEER